jgi:hypothetical protein
VTSLILVRKVFSFALARFSPKSVLQGAQIAFGLSIFSVIFLSPWETFRTLVWAAALTPLELRKDWFQFALKDWRTFRVADWSSNRESVTRQFKAEIFTTSLAGALTAATVLFHLVGLEPLRAWVCILFAIRLAMTVMCFVADGQEILSSNQVKRVRAVPEMN